MMMSSTVRERLLESYIIYIYIYMVLRNNREYFEMIIGDDHSTPGRGCPDECRY